jgi:hypothetical protein
MSTARRVPGFVPGRKWGHGCGKPPMTHHPHADLIGLTFPVDGGAITVTGPVSWSGIYLAVDTPTGPSVRPVAVLRRRKELG